MSISLLILLVTCAVSLYAFSNREYLFRLDYSPYSVLKQQQWYRIISHAFIHADGFHLVVNMYVLHQFGRLTESSFEYYFEEKSTYYYLLLYLGGILFATLPAMKRHRDNPAYRSLGASGAVSAVVFSAILLNPMVTMFFGIPAFIFGIIYLIFEVYMDKRSQDNIAHDAHYWGAIFGLLFTAALKPALVLYFISQIIGRIG